MNTNEIFVYDSLMNTFSESPREKHLIHIACMLMTNQKDFILNWADIQHQDNGTDCGLFSIANTIALCEGKSPQTYNWVKRTMRKHLADCFKRGKISLFPFSSDTRSNKGITNKEIIKVYCYCRQPKSTEPMVTCIECIQWFHRNGCNTVSDDKLFKCNYCK